MKIEQLDLYKENLLELLKDDDVYYVRVNFRSEKNSEEVLPHPFGISFNRLNNAKFRDLIPMIESGEVAIVRVTQKKHSL